MPASSVTTPNDSPTPGPAAVTAEMLSKCRLIELIPSSISAGSSRSQCFPLTKTKINVKRKRNKKKPIKRRFTAFTANSIVMVWLD